MSTVERLSKVTLAVTHPGIFHADDVCAIAWLQMQGCQAPVVRRNPTQEELKDPNVLVVDVGGEYCQEAGNFDHHQRGGAGVRANGIPFAAFGLVYTAFPLFDGNIGDRFHEKMVLPIDATDCGWGTMEGTRPVLSFSAVLAGFNPPAMPGYTVPADKRDDAFHRAVEVAKQVLENACFDSAAYQRAKESVRSALALEGGKLLLLDCFVQWQDHVFTRPDQADLLYVAYPSERGGYCLQQMPKEPGSFEGRKPLPEAWRGLRGAALSSVVTLPEYGESTFCHPAGFIGGAESLAGVVTMARAAIAS